LGHIANLGLHLIDVIGCVKVAFGETRQTLLGGQLIKLGKTFGSKFSRKIKRYYWFYLQVNDQFLN